MGSSVLLNWGRFWTWDLVETELRNREVAIRGHSKHQPNRIRLTIVFSFSPIGEILPPTRCLRRQDGRCPRQNHPLDRSPAMDPRRLVGTVVSFLACGLGCRCWTERLRDDWVRLPGSVLQELGCCRVRAFRVVPHHLEG
jgi:hypothetical protein